MKKLLLALIVILGLSSPVLAACPGGNDYCVFYKNVLTGGTDNALDGIAAATPTNNSAAIVITATNTYIYTYDTTSGATESSPEVIAPDDAGNERWLLTEVVGRVTTKTTASSYTIGTTDVAESYSGVIYVTSASTITAAAVADGMKFTVITIGATAVSLDMNASDKMYLDGTLLDDGDKATNTSTTGDLITCIYYSADGFYCASGSNAGTQWSDGGA